MRKTIEFVLVLVCMSVVSALYAQPNTMSGFVAGAITQNNTYSVLGQPFVGTSEGYGYQVTEGIAQSQLEREEFLAVVNLGEGYNQHGFDYPTTISAGEYQGRKYLVHGAVFNYDSLTTLQLVVLGEFNCGNLLYDIDLNHYRTAEIAGNCWTIDNLSSEHYSDGSQVTGATIYQSNLNGNTSANLATYGRLYTWHSAVNVPSSGGILPVPDGSGYVQGVCPTGWHLPTVTEANALLALGAPALSSTDLWVEPNANNNSSGFSALPAGSYNSAMSRYEGLHSWAGFWTSAGTASTISGTALQLPYYCDTPSLGDMRGADALSVRCVKNS